MASLSELSVEVLLDNLLPVIPLSDLLNLACTSRFFAALCADDTFWKRKLELDFNFSNRTARSSGWKFIYRGLRNPKVFVWGQKDQGRLGLSKFPKSSVRNGVPFPTELRIPGVRVVALIAGGMSFHALDAEGQVHVWGALNGGVYTLNSDGYAEPGKQAHSPLRLALPAPTKSISCGRFHALALDVQNKIWNLTSWGRPFYLRSALLSGTTLDTTPRQIECGWGFSAVLTQSGDIYVWWPSEGGLGAEVDLRNQRMYEDVEENDGWKARATSEGVIPCVCWELDVESRWIVKLPTLPALPTLRYATDDATLYEQEEEDLGGEVKVVEIAGMEDHIVALTNRGHVLVSVCRVPDEEDQDRRSVGSWVYLPEFSELERVRAHPVFNPSGGAIADPPTPPTSLKITHISAHFHTFVAYSRTTVLLGSSSALPAVASLDSNLLHTAADGDGITPNILPALQNRSVISVVVGDYHTGALTSDGRLLTWGQFSAGALGLGGLTEETGDGGEARARERVVLRRPQPRDVEVPTEVSFDWGMDGKRKVRKTVSGAVGEETQPRRFVFGATAAGWHMGALVIDLEPGEDEGDDPEPANLPSTSTTTAPNLPPYAMPGAFPTDPELAGTRVFGPGQVPLMPAAGVFRVGFAGRGAVRGRGIGRGREIDPGNVDD